MITKTNFKDVLKTLDFTTEGNTFQKSIGEADLKVDFGKQRLIYPEGLKVNREDTCNLSQNENFVVFECVHRLLDKGYKPEHLELEPTWRIGHSASGGRADILVRDQEKNSLLIIECKTAGDEFDKAWKKTLQDGDQLFSYAQQIRRTQYLCLYASDFVENGIRINQRIIAHHDDENILAQDETSQSFAEAADVEDRYTVWRETYQLESAENGVFEDNVQAYQIGKNKHTLAEDTKIIDAADKEGKYHQFRTILRKHNIARRENAFEVLVNLFLCKLVDEEENQIDLQFYWKGMTYDNYFDFVDRLQNLYQKGMRKFLNEEISYISSDQIDAAFWTVKNKRNATKQQIQRYFRELKFFSNSAFSFLDTHNEALFKRNTRVLSEVVQMWQGLRLKAEVPNQFLGDMFEMFLDDGVKQSEGQFFTPLPICKFIVASLPLARKIRENSEPLNAIDYACGSGHFLNEYAHQIKPLVEASGGNLSDYYSQINGIEKEDRLAKVAKVAAYMHGQEQIKIFDADTLAFHPNKVPPESFDVLVANPPYAVDGFLQTLSDEDKKQYQLMQVISDNSNTDAIECFFLERIHHLMTPDGLVGVIVRDSILYNTEAVYTRTREILLQYFDLVSIVKLGNKTFSQTGTLTVVLFLRRKAQRPEAAEHYRNRVENFFEGDEDSEIYQDYYLIKAYCNHIDVSYEEYIKLFDQTSLEPLSNLLEYDIFKDYTQAFSQSTEIKNLKRSKDYKEKTPTEQSAELEHRFIAYLHKIEKEKLYYFILAHEQENKVIIVNAPNTKKDQKQFLGYEWSNRKGNEGIQYNGGETVNDIITPLFDPQNLDNDTKINTAIKQNFTCKITEPLPEYCHYAKLPDMLNFSRVDFDKTISLNSKLQVAETLQSVINSEYEMKKIDKVLTLEYGISLPENKRINGDFPVYGSNGVVGNHNEFLIKAPCIIVGRKGSAGEVNWSDINCTPIDTTFYVKLLDETTADLKFTYYILKSLNLPSLKAGSGPGGINRNNIYDLKIPIPPLEVQQQIVNKCEVVEQETDQARQTITTVKQQIEAKVQSVINSEYEMKKIDRILTLEYGTSLPENKRVNGGFPVYGSNGVVGSHNEFSVKAPCIIVGRKGSAGEINWSDKNCTPIDTTFYVKLLNQRATDLKFIYLMLKSLKLPSLTGGSGPGGINRNNVYGLQIPMPPFDIQQQLVAEVKQLEAKITEAQAVIDNATERKNAILTKYL